MSPQKNEASISQQEWHDKKGLRPKICRPSTAVVSAIRETTNSQTNYFYSVQRQALEKPLTFVQFMIYFSKHHVCIVLRKFS